MYIDLPMDGEQPAPAPASQPADSRELYGRFSSLVHLPTDLIAMHARSMHASDANHHQMGKKHHIENQQQMGMVCMRLIFFSL
ncbi:hypothetical protein DsansV1_C06g0060091 [Dioscorea sansibarensis]